MTRRRLSLPPVGTLVVVALLAGVTTVGVNTSRRPAAPTAPASVEVVGSTAVCPDLRVNNNGLTSRASVGAAPLPPGRTATGGSVEAFANSTPAAIKKLPINGPGQVSVGLGTKLNSDALVVNSTGPLSAGLEAEQVTRGENGRDRGLAGLRCDPPRTEAWFVGGGTSVDDVTILVLANVDDTPATVDVAVFSKTGPVDPRAGQGLTIEPHTRAIINMDTLAPDRTLLAVHVLSRRGRVAAALRQSTVTNSVPQGVDWVPQSVPPSTSVVVPGIPMVGNGQRSVLVSNPGGDDTDVSIQVTASDSQFVPVGLDRIPVPAGSSVAIRVDPLALRSALGVRVVSTGAPVLAGAFVSDRQIGLVQEYAYSGGSLPLSGPALMTDLVINPPTESTLILTAPDTAAKVVVTPIRVLGTGGALPAPKLLTVPAGRTVMLRLSTFYPPGATVQLALEVRPQPGSGPVYAGRYLREHGLRGPLTTLLDLQGPAQRVSRPLVVQDPQLGN
ncbi:MAG: hypothetical protein JWM02_2150 [Frankiales bacterium]|nr:hypothetical protein [Frankiales bacterium]